jgi:hypothetical protein
VSSRSSERVIHEHISHIPTVSPSALRLAAAAIRRGYILPETMQHPVIQFECINLALLIMAWGLAPTAGHADRLGKDRKY